MKKWVVSMASIGLVVGWVLGRQATTTWLSIIILVWFIFTLALILRLVEYWTAKRISTHLAQDKSIGSAQDRPSKTG